MSRRASHDRPGPAATFAAGLVACAALAGCGGGPPRRPEPPPERGAVSPQDGVPPRGDAAREVFAVRGARDTWDEPLPILHALKQLGGVKDAWVDEATGKYVVLYDPRRTTREQLDRCVRETGREVGREYEPLFDSR
ncbi:MAG: hypothetical protein M9894_01850 [Planctomycetes bacterium]|nr:hypothetical protein [Planctomycetota bacterium]